MEKTELMRNLLILIFFFTLLLPRNTYAYLDPGTGSYIIQIVLAILTGLLFSFRFFWTKIRQVLGNLIFRNKIRRKKRQE